MKKLMPVIAVLLASVGCSADAATVKFIYQGAPVSAGGDPAGVQLSGMSGSFTLDTSRYLSGSLANSSFRIIATDLARSTPSGIGIEYTYVVTNGSVTETGFDAPFLLSVEGDIARFFHPGEVFINEAFIRFGVDSEIVGWKGTDYDGGSSDWEWSNISGDSFGGSTGFCVVGEETLCTTTPGTWTSVVLAGVYPSPSPVPLPAGGLLLLTGLAGFAGLRFRGRPAQ